MTPKSNSIVKCDNFIIADLRTSVIFSQQKRSVLYISKSIGVEHTSSLATFTREAIYPGASFSTSILLSDK